jgi:phosphatidylserine/phosphatidylglycerophosphate/cardiolipin synthase-like enzyme
MVALLFAFISTAGSFEALASRAPVEVVHLYDNSSDGSPLVSLIDQAKKSIDVEIYTMKDLRVIKALKAAVVRGVKLRIIQTPNPVADNCPVFKPSDSTTSADCVELRSFVSYVKARGGQYESFSFDLCGIKGASCFEHGKMMIFDQKKVLISTGNFDPTNLCDLPESPAHCNRDFTAIATDAKSVEAYSAIFSKDLIATPYDLRTILETAPDVTASPMSMKPIVDFIRTATKTLQIENQYLNDPTMNAAIIGAAKRGVKVSVMVASVTSFGALDPTEDAAKISHWRERFKAFDQAGISSRVFDDAMRVNGRPGYLHAKTILVDGVHAWVGSVNGSTMSLASNREFGIFSDDKIFVKHLGEVMNEDFSNRDAESWIESLNCKKDSCTSPVIDPGSNDDDPDGN